jgi:hypothetical protein
MADELAASEARRRYRTEPMPAMQPDLPIAALLRPDEVVLAVRRGPGPGETALLPGVVVPASAPAVYLTSERLVHCGPDAATLELGQIADAILLRGGLVLILDDGSFVRLEVDRPRVFRVEIATARAAARPAVRAP